MSAQAAMSSRIKRLAKQHVPLPVIYAFLSRSTYWHRYFGSQRPFAEKLVQAFGARVHAGAFKGARIVPDVFDNCLLPKLIGCYEEELYPTIDELVAIGFDRVVDIGCASGWYVLGMGHRMPSAKIHAFDMDLLALRRCRRNVAANGLQNSVTIGEYCDHDELERLAGDRTVVICDIEGSEVELLDPARCPSLLSTHILVELHDVIREGCTETITKRFAPSHDIQLTTSRERNPADYKETLAVLPPDSWAMALDEVRPGPMQWAYLKPKDRGATPTA